MKRYAGNNFLKSWFHRLTAKVGLEKKRIKYKAIKQGMMQELLTGRIRLV